MENDNRAGRTSRLRARMLERLLLKGDYLGRDEIEGSLSEERVRGIVVDLLADALHFAAKHKATALLARLAPELIARDALMYYMREAEA